MPAPLWCLAFTFNGLIVSAQSGIKVRGCHGKKTALADPDHFGDVNEMVRDAAGVGRSAA